MGLLYFYLHKIFYTIEILSNIRRVIDISNLELSLCIILLLISESQRVNILEFVNKASYISKQLELNNNDLFLINGGEII